MGWVIFISMRAIYSALIFCGVCITVLAAWLLTTRLGYTAPVLNQVLSGAQAFPAKGTGCPSLRIGFNFRIRYISHFPVKGGSELRIKIKPLDRVDAQRSIDAPRETVRAPDLPGIDIRSIEFEVNGSGPTLFVEFAEPVSYNVKQGSDFTSILVRLAGQGASGECRASLATLPQIPGSIDTADTDPDISAKTAASEKPGRAKPAKAKPDDAGIDALMSEARSAITKKNYRSAIQILTKLIGLSPHKDSAEAQELLGVVRERNGQIAHAKAEYNIYLKKYPKGEGAGRVRQRLAAIATAESEPPRKLRKAGTKPAQDGQKIATAKPKTKLRKAGAKAATKTAAQPVLKPSGVGQVAAGTAGGTAQPEADQTGERAARIARAEIDKKADFLSAFETEFFGSLSEFYFRNQEFTRLKEFESRRTTKDDDIFQNSLQSSLDLIGSAESDELRLRSRFSGGHEADLTDGLEHSYRVSALYGEIELKRPEIFARVGRQTRNSGGILGRFDGGLFSWQVRNLIKLNMTVGSPVDSSRDRPFIHDRMFYGTSIDFEELYGGWDLTVYAIEQRSESLIDRRAVGAEVLYVDEYNSVFGSIDYDIYFNRVNAAVLSGSHTFGDNSTISASIDFLYSPNLSLSNALQGQTAGSLVALSNNFSVPEIRELALDRSTKTKSINLAYSRPLNDTWQITVDGTVFDTSGNPASGGVAAVSAVGSEFFTSAQLVGTGVFTDADLVSATARYANTSSSDLYLLDTYTRIPLTRDLRLRPRLRTGYRDLKNTGGREVFANPSLTTDYRITRSTSFELEIGGNWSDRRTRTSRERSTEFFIIAGFRFEF